MFSGADQLAPQSAAVVQPLQNTTPSVQAAVSTSAVPSGAFPVGAAGIGLASGARAGRGADTVRQTPSRTATAGRDTPGGTPLGGLGGARAAGEKDKEHKRKYSVIVDHEEVFEVAPPVIEG